MLAEDTAMDADARPTGITGGRGCECGQLAASKPYVKTAAVEIRAKLCTRVQYSIPDTAAKVGISMKHEHEHCTCRVCQPYSHSLSGGHGRA